MKGLLDTHTFIWWDSDPSKLSARALAFLQDPTSLVLLSVASIWEMLIKLHLGKLKLRPTVGDDPDATTSQWHPNPFRIFKPRHGIGRPSFAS